MTKFRDGASWGVRKMPGASSFGGDTFEEQYWTDSFPERRAQANHLSFFASCSSRDLRALASAAMSDTTL